MAPSLSVAASLLLLPSALAAGLYTKNSPVIQVDGTSYSSLIAKSNHTSIVEFYAPWCGHCKNLQPAYEKAAKSLSGLAKVAAVNCDDELNKPFCGSMGVQGFPTLKIVKPGRVKDGKKGKPIVEDYQGPRTAKGIVDAVVEKIPNHVKRLTDKDYEAWLEEGNGPKAVLFSDKSSTSATLKAIAVDFLGGISVAQIRDKEKQAVQVFSVEKFPTLVLLPGEGKEPITFEGKMEKESMVSFLSQAVAPNPDPAPKKGKAKSSSSKGKAKSSEASCPYSKSSAGQGSKDAKTARPSQTLEDLEDESQPTESPDPNVVREDTPKPVKVPEAAPVIPQLSTTETLQRACLNSKAGTCILVFPSTSDDVDSAASVSQAVNDLSDIHYKHVKSERSLFPFYQLSAESPDSSSLRKSLNLAQAPSKVDIIAVNGKRGWYRHYSKPTLSRYDLEEWIDAIRMGDGAKEKLPEAVVVNAADLPAEKVKLDMNDPEGVREALEKENFKEGVDFEMEEIDDAKYEQLMAEAKAGAAARKAAEGSGSEDAHVEL